MLLQLSAWLGERGEACLSDEPLAPDAVALQVLWGVLRVMAAPAQGKGSNLPPGGEEAALAAVFAAHSHGGPTPLSPAQPVGDAGGIALEVQELLLHGKRADAVK